jgi:DNA (cytosine-5)-methyltransferase 1
MNFIDLCCCIGGFHHALNRLGMRCVLASDIDKECRDIYEKNFNIGVHGDLKGIHLMFYVLDSHV